MIKSKILISNYKVYDFKNKILNVSIIFINCKLNSLKCILSFWDIFIGFLLTQLYGKLNLSIYIKMLIPYF